MVPKNTYADGSTPRVCIIGAGVGGLCAAVQLKRELHLASFVVYEKGGDVGGVWLANSYPGCEVDIPAWIYSYSFALNPNWSQLNPGRDEMLAYFQGVARKYDIYAHTQFHTEVLSAVWNEQSQTWTVVTARGRAPMESQGKPIEEVHEFDVVIVGTGVLREPHYPRVFDGFSGPKMHSAVWNPNLPLDDRVVGVVGSSSSAIQVIPSIAPRVKKVIVYMREPTFIGPKVQWSTSWLFQRLMALMPCLMLVVRGLVLVLTDLVNYVFKSGNLVSKAAPALFKARLWLSVRDESIRKQLMPRHTFGYKLPPIAYSSYYRAYNSPKVQLVRSPILAADGTNITTEDGHTESLDVLILCTGFKSLDFFAPMKIIGSGGCDLLNLWRTRRPETFYGVTCHAAPNLFFLLGPHGASITNGNIFNLECQVMFTVNALRALMSRNARSIRVTRVAQAECMAEIDKAARNRTYMEPQPAGTSPTRLVTSNGDTIIWPKSNTLYWLRTRHICPSNFEFTGRRGGGGEAVNVHAADDIREKFRMIEDVV